MTIKIAVIIPAYNEQDAIASVVHEVCALSTIEVALTPIVVNDCSSDNTGVVINNLPCVALHLPVNLGIGGAVQTGFFYAYENDYDYAIQIDGDGQHPPNQIVKLMNFANAKKFNVVIGSRFIEGKGFQSTFLRRVGINYFGWLNKLLIGVKITDSTSGFRLLDRKALQVVCEYYPDDYPEPESIVLYVKNNLTIGETPVEMLSRHSGESSIGIFSSLYYMWKVTLGIIFTFIRTNQKIK